MNSVQLFGAVQNFNHQQNMIEVIWAAAQADLQRGSFEVTITPEMFAVIGQQGVKAIADRFSAFHGSTHASILNDPSGGVIRILPPPSSLGGSNMSQPFVAATESGDVESSTSPSAVTSRAVMNTKAKLAKDRMAKVPRPANAFILYRQDHHPVIKGQRPNIHNNEISIIIGNMWKNEKQEVKDTYKKKADEVKRKHNELHPEYQYSPRRPSEKKKRATKRNVLKSAMSKSEINDSSVEGSSPGAMSQATANTESHRTEYTHSVPTSRYTLPVEIPGFHLLGPNNNTMAHTFDPMQPGLFEAMVQRHNANLAMPLDESDVCPLLKVQVGQDSTKQHAENRRLIDYVSGVASAEAHQQHVLADLFSQPAAPTTPTTAVQTYPTATLSRYEQTLAAMDQAPGPPAGSWQQYFPSMNDDHAAHSQEWDDDLMSTYTHQTNDNSLLANTDEMDNVTLFYNDLF